MRSAFSLLLQQQWLLYVAFEGLPGWGFISSVIALMRLMRSLEGYVRLHFAVSATVLPFGGWIIMDARGQKKEIQGLFGLWAPPPKPNLRRDKGDWKCIKSSVF